MYFGTPRRGGSGDQGARSLAISEITRGQKLVVLFDVSLQAVYCRGLGTLRRAGGRQEGASPCLMQICRFLWSNRVVYYCGGANSRQLLHRDFEWLTHARWHV